MTIHHFTQQDFENIRKRLPPGIWDKLKELPYSEDANHDFLEIYNRSDISLNERMALQEYKSMSGDTIQRYLRDRRVQKSSALNNPLPMTASYYKWAIKSIPHIDSLIAKNKLPPELSGNPLYRGTRIDYGTALIKSGKKPGDTIRDPRYQSFSLNPGTAMYHTAKSQFGDSWDPDLKFKPRKKVLIEHYAKEGETGIYSGPGDSELEVIYPRNKTWKITGVRDEDVTYAIKTGGDPLEGKQNTRIYTVERKKKHTTKKKPIRKPIKKCSCKKK